MSTLSYELGFLARRELSVILDRTSPQGRDWRGLADRMKFTYGTVMALQSQRSPTLALLEEWERTAGSEATIVTLMSLLESLHCQAAVNILEEEKARCIERVPPEPKKSPDIEVEKERLTHEAARPQVNPIEIEESLSRVRSQKYDVFLSYAEEDQDFAEEMRTRLVTCAKLRVFIPSDGLMPGKVFHEQIADMIKKGCRKTVIILSPDYLRSPWCGYEANQALVASPDMSKHILIPVLYRKCQIPAFLAPIYYSDYPRHQHSKEECERCFWQKLYRSLTYDPLAVPSESLGPPRLPARRSR